MIEIKHLSKVYAGSENEVTAINDLCVTLGDRGLVFILGKSGCGKSTLLNLLGGMDTPTSGEITVDGIKLSGMSSQALDEYRNQKVGFVFQDFNLLNRYNVSDNISLALELQGKRVDGVQINEVLRKVELVDKFGDPLYNRKVSELSGGQKQRVAIARALIKDPSVILADEPTGALDSQTSKAIFELLCEISKERLVVVVSHDRESAKLYGERIIELKDGKIFCDQGKETANTVQNKKVKESAVKHTGLPVKRTLAMALNGFKNKTFRLVSSVILAVVSFTVFGFSVTAAVADGTTAELRTLQENGITHTLISADSDSYSELTKMTSLYTVLSQKQLKDIHEYSNILALNVTPEKFLPNVWDNLPIEEDYFAVASRYNNPYLRLTLGAFSMVLELTEYATEDSLGITPDARFLDKSLCRLPKSPMEIAITDVKADAFIEHGFREDDGTMSEIETPDDLIGKVLASGLTVCGVYSTEESRAEILKYNAEEYDLGDNRYMRTWIVSPHISNACFVGNGYYYRDEPFFEQEINSVYIALQGELQKDRALFDTLTYTETIIEERYGMEDHCEYHCSAKLSSAYSYFTEQAMELLPQPAKIAVMVVSVTFAVFSVLLLLNFFTNAVEARKQEFGILRAMGASAADTLAIFVLESSMIVLVNYLLTLVTLGIVDHILNGYLFITLFYLEVAPVLSILAICVGAVLLASIPPMIKLSKNQPMDIIRNN